MALANPVFREGLTVQPVAENSATAMVVAPRMPRRTLPQPGLPAPLAALGEFPVDQQAEAFIAQASAAGAVAESVRALAVSLSSVKGIASLASRERLRFTVRCRP